MAKRTGRKHALSHTILCEWCGEHKETSREDTKTCCDSCRGRLARWMRTFDYAPPELPGHVTFGVAERREVLRLIREEARRRRAALAAIRAGE